MSNNAASDKEAASAVLGTCGPEYVSVYETLGAKIDVLEKQLEDKTAEIAILVSRALTAEAKLNIGKSGHEFVPFDNIPDRCKFCGNSKESHRKSHKYEPFRGGKCARCGEERDNGKHFCEVEDTAVELDSYLIGL